MNEGESTFQIECEIAGRATERILHAYEKNLTVLGDYDCGQQRITTLDADYANENIRLIVGSLRRALHEVIPDWEVLVDSASLKRMVWLVFGALKLHPIREKNEEGQDIIYEASENLGEIETIPPTHNRIKKYLDDTFNNLQKKLDEYEEVRHDALEDFYFARSDTQKNDAHATILQSLNDIRVARESITDFCAKNGMEDPFDYKKKSSLSFSQYDTSPVATLWHIFHLSSCERVLAQFLPEGTRKEEPYLFHFLLAGLKIGKDIHFSDERFAVYEKIYERKLLIHYYASVSTQSLSEMKALEVNWAISQLNFEIMACQKSVSQAVDVEKEESERENIISRMQPLYRQAEALRERCSTTEVGYDVVAIFDSILRHLSGFLVQPNASEPYVQEDLSNNPAEKQKNLHQALQHSLHDLGSCGNISPVTDMRRILHEVISLLAHI